MTAADLLDLYQHETDPSPMIDLSGGQPDLVPEWVLWMMEERAKRQWDDRVYLWSDDNLSNDFFWRFLSEAQQEVIATCPMYSRVCCFKGFNEESFSFNTMAEPALFGQQFDLMGRLIATGMKIYGYVTFTGPSTSNLIDDVRRFVDRLQEVKVNLPLRIVPLEILPFTPARKRLDAERAEALEIQHGVLDLWMKELQHRFSSAERALSIVDVPL